MTTRARALLLVPVPAADPVIGAFRECHDPSARGGMPAHMTVTYPFLAEDELTSADEAALRDLAAATAPFAVDLEGTGWFGDRVLFLPPRDPAPAIDLARRISAAFPQFPFGGDRGAVHPHVTVGISKNTELLRSLEREVTPLLPVRGEARELQLWADDAAPGQRRRWRLARSFGFGAPA